MNGLQVDITKDYQLQALVFGKDKQNEDRFSKIKGKKRRNSNK